MNQPPRGKTRPAHLRRVVVVAPEAEDCPLSDDLQKITLRCRILKGQSSVLQVPEKGEKWVYPHPPYLFTHFLAPEFPSSLLG
jgi:hypothetical protein